MFCMMQLDVIWATKKLGFKRLLVSDHHSVKRTDFGREV